MFEVMPVILISGKRRELLVGLIRIACPILSVQRVGRMAKITIAVVMVP